MYTSIKDSNESAPKSSLLDSVIRTEITCGGSFVVGTGCDYWEENSIVAHRIRISEILPLDRKSYLTHAILFRLSREGYIHKLYWNSTHCRQVTSLLC